MGGVIVGIAEPAEGQRRRFLKKYVFGPDEEKLEFSDWREMVTEEGKRRVAKVGVDGMLVCKSLFYCHG